MSPLIGQQATLWPHDCHKKASKGGCLFKKKKKRWRDSTLNENNEINCATIKD